MYVLVDYDNLLVTQKAWPLHDFARRVADIVCPATPAPPTTLDFRLYGGWYTFDHATGAHAPTQRAQDLMIELTSAAFPFYYRASTAGTGVGVRVRIQASLGRSLLVDPARDLVRTLRPKRLINRIKPRSTQGRCQHADPSQCCLRGLKRLVSHNACPECPMPSSDLIPDEPQQKLVDTMIAVDLVNAAASPEGVVLVSSDDDFVPPIWQGVISGGTVYHLHTHAGRTLMPHYLPATGLRYTSLTF